MAKIVFFCIPAFGHTNPTIEVVRNLTERGHIVHYYSYQLFKNKIEAAGAEFISCDVYDLQMNLKPEDAERVGKDLGFSIKLMVNTTLALDEMVCDTLKAFKPDCIVTDSMAVWGKFAALKLNIPFISSTTTFAFNRYSSKIMKQNFTQMFALLKALPGINKDLKRLRRYGYPVKNVLSMIQNDNDTHTIVYTSKEFQPCADTFSKCYHFVGPSIKVSEVNNEKKLSTVYISLGTVINNHPDFYKNCINAFKDTAHHVIMAVGERFNIDGLKPIPDNFEVVKFADQISILQNTSAFITHCGMNSVSEGLYFGVPLVLFPQTPEQQGVANRVLEMKAGVLLKENKAESIRSCAESVLNDQSYKNAAEKIAEGFRHSGGAAAAADVIESFIK